MTDIPEDIRYIAQHVCGYVEAMPSEGNVNVIASAIMAERERCAQIAETGKGWIGKYHRGEFSAVSIGIATAIRTPSTPKRQTP